MKFKACWGKIPALMGNAQRVNFKLEGGHCEVGTISSTESIGLEISRNGQDKKTVIHKTRKLMREVGWAIDLLCSCFHWTMGVWIAYGGSEIMLGFGGSGTRGNNDCLFKVSTQ